MTKTATASQQSSARKRLPPEERKEQILDVAASLIREHGVSALNMDRLGREAGVSKPLVYVYFTNRVELLKALLLRETRRYDATSEAAANSAVDMEDLVRKTSRAMLEYVTERGIVLQQLMIEPEVAEVLRKIESRGHETHVEFLSGRLMRDFGIPREVAELTIEFGLGISRAAGAYVERTKADLDFVEDVMTTMIMGSVNAIALACATKKLTNGSD